jgi:hypothetical protein
VFIIPVLFVIFQYWHERVSSKKESLDDSSVAPQTI